MIIEASIIKNVIMSLGLKPPQVRAVNVEYS